MSIDTTITIKRGASTIAQHLPAQIDEKNPVMAASYNAAHPYDVFDLYLKSYTGAVLRGDLFIDELNIDPLTSTNVQYRAAGRPEYFPDQHWECVANLIGGPA